MATLGSASFELCDAGVVDHIRMRRLGIDRVVPGKFICIRFEATPNVTLRRGVRVLVEVPKVFEAEYDLCHAAALHCPTPTLANVSGTICETVPLAAIMLAGQQVPFTLQVLDEAGAPLSCIRGAAAVADGVAIDVEVESLADEAAHHPLRRALHEVADARTGAVVDATEDRASGIRRLLRDAYEASPEWADAFARWRSTHRRRELQQGASDDAQAVLAEARSFAQFRENVLSAHRSGRSLSVDERLDMRPDARRTLGHFG